MGPWLDGTGVQSGAGLPGPVRDHGIAAIGPTRVAHTHFGLAATARHARPALLVPARSSPAVARRWYHRLALGRGRESRCPNSHDRNGLACRDRPYRRATSRAAADDRSPGRTRWPHHAAGPRRDETYASTVGAG